MPDLLGAFVDAALVVAAFGLDNMPYAWLARVTSPRLVINEGEGGPDCHCSDGNHGNHRAARARPGWDGVDQRAACADVRHGAFPVRDIVRRATAAGISVR